MTPVDLAQVEGMVVLAAVRAAAEVLVAMAQTANPEEERAVLLQWVTLKEVRDELAEELKAIDVALDMIHAHLTDLEISLES